MIPLALPAASRALWTPAKITTALWLDAADSSTITESGGAVSQWADKSGNERNFTGSGSTAPATGVSTQNNLNVLDFEGDYLTSSSVVDTWSVLHNGSQYAVFFVFQAGITANPNIYYGLIGNNAGSTDGNAGVALWWDNRTSLSRSDELRFLVGNGSTNLETRKVFDGGSGTDAVPANTMGCCGIQVDLTNATASSRALFRVNGSSVTGDNTQLSVPSESEPLYALQLGAIGNGVGLLTGKIAEVVIALGSLSELTPQTIEGYLAHKWDLAANLPSDHPYKSAAP